MKLNIFYIRRISNFECLGCLCELECLRLKLGLFNELNFSIIEINNEWRSFSFSNNVTFLVNCLVSKSQKKKKIVYF